ncbi:DUF4123 domain-containing protein [Rhizobium oryziradicis]|uniref:DUF4123 domain-containing protein n=1 Tax=Rhizobium oryziradicis TaxID=1867956 RepID=A0A1Q8ZY95_9HYPH|nr:DUF4123 domain-containing protein [Rhizobium oryziradicis]OLP47041.1 hypothetical protein BJF95_12190 [Rhizobium oryziradicis]
MTETPSLDVLPRTEATETIRNTLKETPKPIFALLDGGGFDDLPGMLSAEAIKGRSLFLDGAAEDYRRAGPWMVRVDDMLVQGYIERLEATQPCAVYWSCKQGEEILHKHLRTINEVLIPLEEAQLDGNGSKTTTHYERVLFRHWDPNVLGAVLPLLTRPQFSRFLGPATSILFNAPDYGGIKRAKVPDNMPAAPPGPLRLEPDQMEKLKAAMLHSSRLRIARFLKGNIPPHFSGVNDDFVWGATLASEKSADELGIKTERGRARWAYVMMMSDGKAAEGAEVRNYIRDGGDTPDNRVKSLIQHIVNALRSGASVSGGAA